jgi:hypothetical protein
MRFGAVGLRERNGKGGRRRMIKQHLEGWILAAMMSNSITEKYKNQRMPAQFKKIIFWLYRLPTQSLRKGTAQLFRKQLLAFHRTVEVGSE